MRLELEVVDMHLSSSDDETNRGPWFHSLEEHAHGPFWNGVEEAQQPPPPPPPAAPAVAASLMGALSVNEPAAPLLSPSLLRRGAAPVVQKRRRRPRPGDVQGRAARGDDAAVRAPYPLGQAESA